MKEDKEIIFPEYEVGYANHPNGYIVTAITNIRIRGIDRKYYLSRVIKSIVIKEEPTDKIILQVVKEFIIEVYKHIHLFKIDKTNKEITDIFTGKKVRQLCINQISEVERVTKKYVEV